MTTHLLTRTANVDQADIRWIQFHVGGSYGDIDIDNDGVMTDEILIDLSHGLSTRFGRQMSQMMSYDVNYMRIDLENVDDVFADNDQGAAFGGKVEYWSPSHHRIAALKMARKVETLKESIEIDADSFFMTTDFDYSGFRFNWDADNQVQYATAEFFSNLAGNQWDMKELFDVYDVGVGQLQEKTNSLWRNDGRTGYPEGFGWAAHYVNDATLDLQEVLSYKPVQSAFIMNMNEPISVLGGLMNVKVTHSSVDAPGGVDDDYRLRITVGVTGWRTI